MKPASAASALKVQAALGPDYQVLEFDAGTRTAADAAAAIGCTVAEIAKSLVFRAEASGRAVVVVASGVNRVDEAKVGAHLGEPIGRVEPSPTLIDDALFAFEAIWAAAGTPNAVFRLTPADLLRLTGGIRAAIAR